MDCNTLIVGGGFYGAMLAIHLDRLGVEDICLVEASDRLMSRASYVNQARVHNGYHYPRSIVTGAASRRYFNRFCHDFSDAIDFGLEKVYAIAKNSFVTSNQFARFCGTIGAELRPAPVRLRNLFEPGLVEDVFMAKEICFDASKVASTVEKILEKSNVKVSLNSEYNLISKSSDKVKGEVNGKITYSNRVVACTYNDYSKFSTKFDLSLKKELAELGLISPPKDLRGLGITVMDGPFFSTLPFPSKKAYSMTHVRYTPVCNWVGDQAPPQFEKKLGMDIKASVNLGYMLRDASKFMPCLEKAQMLGSLYEVKSIPVFNERDDGRPIVYEWDPEQKVLCVLGGKIDNIYDLLSIAEMDKALIGDLAH